MTQTERPGLLRHGGFLRLWSALTISRFGSEITFLALPLTAILLLDATPEQMGLLTGLGTLPYLVIGLPAGVWIDRLPRRLILVVSDLVRAMMLLTVPIAAFLDSLTIEQLYGVALIVGVFTVFSDLTEEAFVPSLIERDQLVEGYSKLAASQSVVEIAGPGIAGALLQALSAPLVILVDSVTYLVSALLLGSIRVERSPKPETPLTLSQFRADLVEGLRYVLTHPLLRPMVLTASTLQFFGAMFNALLILHLVEDFNLSPALIAALYMSGSVSGLLAATFGERIIIRFGAGPVHVLGGFLIGLGMLGVALANGSVVAVAIRITLAWLVQGTGNTLFNITYSSIVQTITPDPLLGRVNASQSFIGMGALPLGAFLGGLLAVRIGLNATIVLAGVGGFLAFLWTYLSPLRGLQALASDDSAFGE